MANHKSAKKRIRQNEKTRVRNSQYRAAVRTAIKKTREAVAAGEQEQAGQLFQTAEKKIQQAASHGLYHAKCASRKVGRLKKLVNSLSA